MFERIRQAEREIIPQVDGIVYVSRWARDALLGWFPEAAGGPRHGHLQFRGATASCAYGVQSPSGTLSPLEISNFVKNHRYLLEIIGRDQEGRGRIFTLDVFGEGPRRKDLVQQISSLGLDEQVRCADFGATFEPFFPGYRAYVHASTPRRAVWRSSRRWRLAFPSWRAISEPFSELFDDGVEGTVFGLSTIRSRQGAYLIDLLDCEPERLKAARSATERFRRDFDADHVAPRLYRFSHGNGA